MRTPLAWLSLIHDRRRLAASVAGVGFAVLLMVTELGFLHAIYDSSTLIVDAFNADLLMISPQKDDFNPSKPFPRQRIEQVRGIAGVADVYPLWFSRLTSWSTSGRSQRDIIRLLAFDPADPVFSLPEIESQQNQLRKPDTALVDRRLRDSYGGLASGVTGELEDRRIQVIGDFALGADLQLNATMLVSDQTYRHALSKPGINKDPLDEVEIGLIQLRDGVDAGIAGHLAASLPEDVRFVTPREFRREVHLFWTRNQPVGAVFGMGMLVGFFIGLMICYQVLFTDVIDQLPQFATLKAMGYNNRFLLRMAVHRGAWLALLALAIGLPTGLATYRLLASITGLTFAMTPGRALLVAIAALLMCITASVLATKKALDTDPAEVF